MIEINELSKQYGSHTAVDGLSFDVRPGIVTGFLGPNGAGKSTTMRMILGLDAPTAGRCHGERPPVPGARRAARARSARCSTPRPSTPAAARATTCWRWPPRRHPRSPGRRGARASSGSTTWPRRRAGTFSLGMGQRLGIAAALLGDPRDGACSTSRSTASTPRASSGSATCCKDLAAEGRTVFVSSHLMSEMALTAEHLIVIGKGRLIADVTAAELHRMTAEPSIHVRTPQATRLRGLLAAEGVEVRGDGLETLDVSGLTSEAIGIAAARAGIALVELTPHRATLEEIFMDLTQDAVEYHAGRSTRKAA